jgi:putative transcriptional regulator
VRNRLRVLRAEREWSQARLADELSVSRQTVNAIETGKYDPSLPLAFKIARVFDQPIEAIFFPDDVDGMESSEPRGSLPDVSADWA